MCRVLGASTSAISLRPRWQQQHHPKIQRWFQRKMRRTCRNIALKSLASKLSKASYHMRRDGVDFNEQLLFG